MFTGLTQEMQKRVSGLRQEKIFTTEEHWGCTEAHGGKPRALLNELTRQPLESAMSLNETLFFQEELWRLIRFVEWKLTRTSAKAQTQFAGKKYYFCSDDCRKTFEEHPDEYTEATAA